MFKPYSVLMTVYYKVMPDELTASIQSILDQTVPTDDLVIVCDGPLPESLSTLLWDMAKAHPAIHLIPLPENRGSGYARQVGLTYCQHEMVAVQDADDISMLDRCARELAFFEAHPDTDVLSGTVLEFTDDPSHVLAKRVLPTEAEEVGAFACRRNPVNHPCVMFRKAATEKAGGYQEFYLLEDYYLWVRVLLSGGIIRNLAEPLLYMRAGSDMYKRRGGWQYAQSQKKLFAYMRDEGMISLSEYRRSVFIRTASALAPNGLRKAMFKAFNREDPDDSANSSRRLARYEFGIRTVLEGFAVLLFAVPWFGAYCRLLPAANSVFDDLICLFMYGMIFHLCADGFTVHHTAAQSVTELTLDVALTSFISNLLIWILMAILAPVMIPIRPMLFLLGTECILGTLWARGTHDYYFDHFPPKKTLLISTGQNPEHDIRRAIVFSGLDIRYHVWETVQPDGFLIDPDRYLAEQPEAVFLVDIAEGARNRILEMCAVRKVDTYVIPCVSDLLIQSAKPLHIFHLPIYKIERQSTDMLYLGVKRVFDIGGSVLALALLSPLFLVTAALIHHEDGGPVFYRQKRLTKDGRIFEVMKFRSMRTDAEKDGVARLSTGDHDSRVTKIGKFIRAHRIDELPQLLNIIRGDMSLVGPRPERPEIAADYEKTMPEFALRLQVKAGLTGYAQVYGKYNTTPDDKLLMDLVYIAHASVWEDFKICVATLKVLFDKESTEGIEEGETTARKEEAS